MSDEKTRILTMLSEGKVSVEEAEKLLKAVETSVVEQDNTQRSSEKKLPKFIRVQVDSSDGDKVNVKVPIQILRSGVRLASLLPAEAQGSINNTMNGIDLSKIGPENIDQFIESLADFTVDVDGPDKVKIFCE